MKQLLAASAGKARARKPATIPCPSCGQAAAGHNQTACVAAQRAKVLAVGVAHAEICLSSVMQGSGMNGVDFATELQEDTRDEIALASVAASRCVLVRSLAFLVIVSCAVNRNRDSGASESRQHYREPF